MKHITSCLAVLVVLAGAGQVQAGPISSITARNNNNDPILMPDALYDGVLAFSDRIDTTWRDPPPHLIGIDYVRMPDSDARNFDFEMDVTLSSSANLYVFVNNVTWGEGPIPWMVDGTFPHRFSDTGDDLRFFHAGGGVSYSVFLAEVPTGTVTLLWNHNSTTNAMYGVAAAVPEPAALTLAAFGVLGLLAFARRRKRR